MVQDRDKQKKKKMVAATVALFAFIGGKMAAKSSDEVNKTSLTNKLVENIAEGSVKEAAEVAVSEDTDDDKVDAEDEENEKEKKEEKEVVH